MWGFPPGSCVRSRMTATATAVISRAVRPGRLDEFRAWADRLDAAVGTQPGFLGLIRLEQSGGLHHLVHRFDSRAALDRWKASPDYHALIEAGRHASVGLHQVKTGERIHLDVPSESGGSKWKLFLVTWVIVLPVLLALSSGIRALFPGLPPLVQTAISSLLLTGALTTVILPRLQRWSRFWLLQDARGKLKTSGDSGSG